jgi:hypothetical protein
LFNDFETHTNGGLLRWKSAIFQYTRAEVVILYSAILSCACHFALLTLSRQPIACSSEWTKFAKNYGRRRKDMLLKLRVKYYN